MAAMETLVNTVMGASLCGPQQKTLSHVLLLEISIEGETEGAGGNTLRETFRSGETTLWNGRHFKNNISYFH